MGYTGQLPLLAFLLKDRGVSKTQSWELHTHMTNVIIAEVPHMAALLKVLCVDHLI